MRLRVCFEIINYYCRAREPPIRTRLFRVFVPRVVPVNNTQHISTRNAFWKRYYFLLKTRGSKLSNIFKCIKSVYRCVYLNVIAWGIVFSITDNLKKNINVHIYKSTRIGSYTPGGRGGCLQKYKILRWLENSFCSFDPVDIVIVESHICQELRD